MSRDFSKLDASRACRKYLYHSYFQQELSHGGYDSSYVGSKSTTFLRKIVQKKERNWWICPILVFCPPPHEVRKGDYWIRHRLSVRLFTLNNFCHAQHVVHTGGVSTRGKELYGIIKAGDCRAMLTLVLVDFDPMEINWAKWPALSREFYRCNLLHPIIQVYPYFSDNPIT